MSTILYIAISCLVALITWLVVNIAWGKDLNPVTVLLITVGITLIWPLALLGLLVVGALILINKPRKL